jgi:hypothetical protein
MLNVLGLALPHWGRCHVRSFAGAKRLINMVFDTLLAAADSAVLSAISIILEILVLPFAVGSGVQSRSRSAWGLDQASTASRAGKPAALPVQMGELRNITGNVAAFADYRVRRFIRNQSTIC